MNCFHLPLNGRASIVSSEIHLDVSISLHRWDENVREPQQEQEDAIGDLGPDRATELGVTEGPGVAPDEQQHDADDGSDAEDDDAEAESSGLHVENLALEGKWIILF